MQPIIYGIPNCDSVRKAKTWLNNQQIDYCFVDVRKTPPTKDQLACWLAAIGAKLLVNKRSTTWKNLSADERYEAEQGDTLAVLLDNPTLIKRPVLEHRGTTTVGFNADTYSERFNSQ